MLKNGNGRATPSPEQTALRVLRVSAGGVLVVKAVSPSIGGLFTHFKSNRAHYCRGADCDAALHKIPRVWRGYAAVESWDEHQKRWFPFCLEVTETCELDFRGLWERGQIWELERLPDPPKRKSPTTAKFLERVELAAVRPVFEIKPTLQRLYHVESIDLSAKNPMPARTMLEPTDGAPPPGRGDRVVKEKPPTAEDWAALQRARNGIFKLPDEKERPPDRDSGGR